MRLTASSALCLSFFIFQLADVTQGMEALRALRASSSSSRSAEASSEAAASSRALEYWIPPPTNSQVNEELARSQDRIFPSSSSRPAHLPPLKPQKAVEDPNSLVEHYEKAKFNPGALPSHDPRKVFIDEMKTEFIPEYKVHLIQRMFKNILENPGVTDDEIKHWFEVLAYVIRKTREVRAGSTESHLAVSALYGLHSLRMRLPERQALLTHIDALSVPLSRDIQQLPQDGISQLRWERELVYPSLGFGPELANRETFEKIFQNDRVISSAVSTSVKRSAKPLETLANEFRSSSAHKRVAILAVFYHQLVHSRKVKQVKSLFEQIERTHNLLPHERALIDFIRRKVKIPLPTPS
ncbi:hypothetical protein PGT21_005884 [Puccinia graminis f. sp. tritici]|uniref:Uncharacterized protein n=1 Tax=Puccinia graminis f. sp. tritici TaxID=56615 RepID=A0A5B0PN54_PUCGR|nr:hypothetical protein PGT21_005884 [Puccinia graminis f. sp. tritici]